MQVPRLSECITSVSIQMKKPVLNNSGEVAYSHQ